MRMRLNFKTNENLFFIVFLLFLSIFYFSWSLVFPFNYGPDEQMRYQIPLYIFNHGNLPHGGDLEIRNAVWGSSYGFTPITPYIISGYLMKVVYFFTNNFDALLYVARAVTVGFSILSIIVIYLISKKIFANSLIKRWCFITFISFLPQYVYISSYVNVDTFAIFCTSVVIYAWIKGLDDNFSYKSCLMLAIGLGLSLISYYNTYGYVLVSLFVFFSYHFYCQSQDLKINIEEIAKKSLFILFIIFAVAGWWFIRNAILYDGDILGMRTCNEYSELYAMDCCKPSLIKTPSNMNQSFLYMLFNKGWLLISTYSFFAMFGDMTIYLPIIFYKIFLLLCLISLLVLIFFSKKMHIFNNFKNIKINQIFIISMIISIVFPIAISMFYSYFNDFQAQGRYIMPGLIPIAFFFASGIGAIIDMFPRMKKIVCLVPIFFVFSSIYSFLFLISYYY